MLYVQYGCGFSAPDGWRNFDASPTLRIERVPFLGRFVRKNSSRFPDAVEFGDIVRGLPVPNNSADGVYASHVLEHLSRADFVTALSNTFALLRPGGVFRLVVPDLEWRARSYASRLERGDTHANDWLMRSAHLGMEVLPSSMGSKLSQLFGHSAHLWMWDLPSMTLALEKAGFGSVRRCEVGDSGDPMFSKVEERSRFWDIENGFPELAVHAVKPI